MVDIDKMLKSVEKLKRIEPETALEKVVIDNIINSHMADIHKARANEAQNKILGYPISEYHNTLNHLEQKLKDIRMQEQQETLKPKLEQCDTAILMCTKNHKIKLKYNLDNDFEFTGTNEILNRYKNVALVYADTRALPLDCIHVEYIIHSMLDIFEVVYPKKFKQLILELLKYSQTEISTRDRLFTELYGYLQALRMLDNNGEEIFDLDYSRLEDTK